MTDPTHAYITHGGIYIVSEKRWAKVTALRAGRVLAGWGDMQGLMSLRRANADEPKWMECEPGDVQLGDCAHFVSRDFWAMCTPIQSIVTGSHIGQVPEGITGRNLLVFTNSVAFRIQDGDIQQLFARGRREPATAEDLIPHLRRALAIDVTAEDLSA